MRFCCIFVLMIALFGLFSCVLGTDVLCTSADDCVFPDAVCYKTQCVPKFVWQKILRDLEEKAFDEVWAYDERIKEDANFLEKGNEKQDELTELNCPISTCRVGDERSCFPKGVEGCGKTGCVGGCKQGKQRCLDSDLNGCGTWDTACQGFVLPKKEVCNNVDDDCNGKIDDSIIRTCYTGPEETKATGLCHSGHQICVSGKWKNCDGEIVPSPEICDTKDNDCDGLIDEGEVCGDCEPGSTRSCYTGSASDIGKGICKIGTQICTDSRKWPTTSDSCLGQVTPKKEICNNLDDNCNGKIDDQIQDRSCIHPRLKGPCLSGLQSCINGFWGTCISKVKPSIETCNNVDDDCNGKVDDQVPIKSCTHPTLKGPCLSGTQTCKNGSWEACVSKVQPKQEICNNADDDCNGKVDDRLQVRNCQHLTLKGPCLSGTQTCKNGSWGVCVSKVQPKREICNNMDDDCNGKVDDKVPTKSCTHPTLKGPCLSGTQACKNGSWEACVSKVQPKQEICNNADDDCNGQVDDKVPTKSCTHPALKGPCLLGTQTCKSGSWEACVSKVQPKQEICNNADDDCDGDVDEGNLCSGSTCLKGKCICIPKRLVSHIIETPSFRSVDFSSNGNLIVVTNPAAETIELWYIQPNKTVFRTLSGPPIRVNSVKFSPNDTMVISGSRDKTVKLWEVATRKLIRTFSGHSDEVISVDFSPNGKMIVSGSRDKTVKLWEVATGKLVRTFSGHSDTVSNVEFSPDGKTTISASDDGTVRLWEIATGKLIKTFSGFSGVVKIKFSPNGSNFASCSIDKTVKLWEVATGKLVRTFSGHSDAVSNIDFDLTGSKIVSTSYQSVAKLWEVATGKLIRTFSGHWSMPYGKAWFKPDGKSIFFRGSFWDINNGSIQRTLSRHGNTVHSVDFNSNGTMIVSGSQDHTLKLWESSTGGLINTFSGHSNDVNSVEFSPDGKTIISGSRDNTAKLWEVSTGKLIKTFSGNSSSVNGIRRAKFSPDGKTIVVGEEDFIKIWEIHTGNLVMTFPKFSGNVESVEFSPGGKNVLVVFDGSLEIREVATGKLVRTFSGQSQRIRVAKYSADGTMIVSGSDDKTIKLWEVSTGKLIKTFSGHSSHVHAVDLSPDGKIAVSGSGDKTIKFWEVATGKLLVTISIHSRGVRSIDFSSNGTMIVSGSGDSDIGIWTCR